MRKTFNFVLLVALLVSGCNFAAPTPDMPTLEPPVASPLGTTEEPTFPPPDATPSEEPSPEPPSATPTDSPLGSATSSIFPTLTLAIDTICRMGPEKHYYPVVKVQKDQSFEASGRNEEETWVSIQARTFGDDCWVPIESLESPGDLKDLTIRYTQPLPGEPINIRASDGACGVKSHQWLYWSSVDAVGYRIYRNGKEIATVYGDKYRDLSTPSAKKPTIYLYEIESFNASGTSPRAGVSVTICG